MRSKDGSSCCAVAAWAGRGGGRGARARRSRPLAAVRCRWGLRTKTIGTEGGRRVCLRGAGLARPEWGTVGRSAVRGVADGFSFPLGPRLVLPLSRGAFGGRGGRSSPPAVGDSRVHRPVRPSDFRKLDQILTEIRIKRYHPNGRDRRGASLLNRMDGIDLEPSRGVHPCVARVPELLRRPDGPAA